ncbi:MAG: TonB family protein, partial [Bacteroidales bacterium]|nr:TonB family protein [Bacteroidales bacterium]
LFLLVYLSGAGAYLIFHFWNLSRILRLMAFSSPSQRYPGQALHNPGIRGTYAFLNRVIWNESRLAPHEQDMVMKHERVHIRQAHGVDILALEWMTVLQWFNPFIFLLRRDLREVHEFLADRGSLANDEDTSAYLRLMLNRALGGEAGNMINAFGHVSLKRRIIMMNNKNRKGSLPRYALAAAAFMLIALWAVRPVDGTAKAIASPGVTLDPVSELPLTAAQEKKTEEVKSMPQYPGGQEAMIRFLVDNIKYPEMARKKGVMGTVYVNFVVNEKGEVNSAEVARGISKEFDEEALRVVKLMNTWKPAVDKEGKPIAVQMTLPVKFELSDKKKD